MSDYTKINGTPWHITYVGLKEGEKKRHRSRCQYYNGSNNYCQKWHRKCTGSAHCKYYKEIPQEEPANTPPVAPSAPNQSPMSTAQVSSLEEKMASFKKGDSVLHKKYGYGKILSFSKGTVRIEFEDESIVDLDLKTSIRNKLLYHSGRQDL